MDNLDEFFSCEKYPLIEKLTLFESLDKDCKKIYCTTCGGLAYSIDKNMNQNLRNEISEFLINHDIDSLPIDKGWVEYLSKFSAK